MLGMLSCTLLPLLLAAWPAVAKDGPTLEAAGNLAALGADDECRVGDAEQCGLNAMQLRRQRTADPKDAEATPAKGDAEESETGPRAPYSQCGGMDYTGVTECTKGYSCFNSTEHYSLCKPTEVVEVPWTKYNGSKVLGTKSEAPVLTFYMYRAIDMNNYPPSNANLGSIGAILWYLHNEVVTCQTCPQVRPGGIERIARYKVQARATQPLFDAGMNFGATVNFNHGRCTTPGGCADIFATYGYVVGCNNLSSDASYSGAMYSLPGACSELTRDQKSLECKHGQPGGLCEGVPTGNGTCTWSYTEAGEVSLNELEGITNYTAFKELGGEEYTPKSDKGTDMDFWDGLHDPKANAMRITKLDALFKNDFPDLPSEKELPAPPCNFNKEKFLVKSSAKAAAPA